MIHSEFLLALAVFTMDMDLAMNSRLEVSEGQMSLVAAISYADEY